MRSKDGTKNYWQVIYLASAAVGAMLSALSSNMLINPEPPIDSFNPVSYTSCLHGNESITMWR
jgi:hypothetical protein